MSISKLTAQDSSVNKFVTECRCLIKMQKRSENNKARFKKVPGRIKYTNYKNLSWKGRENYL